MLAQLGTLHAAVGRECMNRLRALIGPLAILMIGAVRSLIMVAVVMAITSLSTAQL